MFGKLFDFLATGGGIKNPIPVWGGMRRQFYKNSYVFCDFVEFLNKGYIFCVN